MTTTTCKHCQERFTPQRAGAQYCSAACRTAAYRLRHQGPPRLYWIGSAPTLSSVSRTYNADGTLALSRHELGQRLLQIAERDDDGDPKTGRRYYYLALSHGWIKPDMGAEGKKSRDAAYDRVTAVLGVLRMNGDLAWDMVLDLTRELVQWQFYDSPRDARADLRLRYSEDMWLGQSNYPIFVVEKDTMVPVCEPMAERWQMPFASSRGYSSLKLQHDVATAIKRRFAKTGQSVILYFISDFDPSGVDLQRAWEQAMRDFGIGDIVRFVRIGLTIEQVRRHRLQRLSIEVKPSDSRSQRFIEQYGERCWETDILPAAVIEQTLDRAIESWLDVQQWQRRQREIEAARTLL